MNTINNNHQGGVPVVLDDFRFTDAAYREAFYGLLSAIGVSPSNTFKISGVNRTVAAGVVTVSEGYVSIEGEICKFPQIQYPVPTMGQVEYFVIETTYDPNGDVQTESGTPIQLYEVRRASIAISATPPAQHTRLQDAKPILSSNIHDNNDKVLATSKAVKDAKEYAIAETIRRYVSEAFDGDGSTDPDDVPDGELWLGKFAKVIISETMTKVLNTLKVNGHITSDNVLVIDAPTQIDEDVQIAGELNVGNVHAQNIQAIEIDADNAPKSIIQVNSSNVVVRDFSLIGNTAIAHLSAGRWQIEYTDLPIGSTITAIATSNKAPSPSDLVVSAVSSSTDIDIYIRTAEGGNFVDAPFSLIAFIY